MDVNEGMRRHAARAQTPRAGGAGFGGIAGGAAVMKKRMMKIEKRQTREPLPTAGAGDGTEDGGDTAVPSSDPETQQQSSTEQTSRTREQEPSTTTSTPSTTTSQPATTSTTTSSTTSSIPSTSSTTSSVQTTTTTSSERETTTSTSTTSSSIPVTTTTILSTSTSTPSTALTSSTVDPDTIISEPTTRGSITRSLVTSIVTASNTRTAATTSNTSSLAGSSSGTKSDGPSAGTVVGIVAGALVGVVVLSGIIGYVFRTRCKNDKDDEFEGENPFGDLDGAYGANQTRGEMRRDSQLLPDEDDASIHQMSEMGHYATAAPVMAAGAGMGAAAAYGLNRAPTSASNLPGLARSDTVNPRPPTMIQRHYAAMNNQPAAPMPSFQPGQIVNPGQYYPSAQMNQAGPYPNFSAGAGAGVGAAAGAAGMRDRAASPENAYGHHQQQHSLDNGIPMRSGTPEYQNPQQYFHQASDSYSSAMSPFDSPDRNGISHQAQSAQYVNANNYTSHPGDERQSREGNGMMPSEQRAKRTLSVRNGGLNDSSYHQAYGGEEVRDSIYGGM